MRRTLPSITALQCFEVAARKESFTQAAAVLNLTQSAVSRQIRALEVFIEQPLFERVRQRVKLTAAGQRYLAEVVPLLEALETATLRLRSFQALSGSLNIGCYPTLGSRWLLPYLLRFSHEVTDLSTNTITYLDNLHFDPDIIDIGIVQGDPPWPGMRSDFLMPEDLAPVVAPTLMAQAIQHPNDLLSYRLLHHITRPQSWPIWFDTMNLSYNQPPGGLIFSQFEMVIEATVAGHGISMLPLILVQKELADGRLQLAHAHIVRTQSAYYLLTPLDKVVIPKIEVFRQWLLRQLG